MKTAYLYKTYFALFLLSLLFSCKKGPILYTFQGTLQESVNATNLSGVDVKIAQKTYDGNVSSAFFNSVGSLITDANGYYELSFEREKVVEFKIELLKNGYFALVDIINSSEVTTAEPNIFNYTLEPKSWIRFNLMNLGGLTSDEFTMIHYNFREDCDGCTTNEYYYYYGSVDSTFTYTSTGGEFVRYSYKTPGSSVYIQDSVYTTLFDTVDVNLNY